MDFQQASDEFLSYLQIEKNCSEHTIRAYAYDLGCFYRFLIKHSRSTELDAVTNSTVRRFVQDQVLTHGIKAKTLRRRISCLKSLSTFCLKENYIPLDFVAGILPPKLPKRLPTYMRLDELQKLLRNLQQDTGPLAIRNQLIFTLLATTGLRRQELVDLNWEHIDLLGENVKVLGKGNK